jgi:thioredoxin 1
MMNKSIARNLFAYIVVVLVGCQTGVAQQSAVVLSADSFERQLKEKDDEQTVDVRSAEEFQKGHIENAFNINIDGKEFQRQVSALDKSRPVFVYCLSGARSARAAAYMRKNGFAEVYELNGGLMQWNRLKKPVVAKNVSAPGMSSNTFNKHLLEKKLVLVDFYARWCAPCKKMSPELQALQDEYQTDMLLLKINADDNDALMDSLKVEALPGILLFRDGKKVWANFGLTDKETIRKHIDKNL